MLPSHACLQQEQVLSIGQILASNIRAETILTDWPNLRRILYI